MFVLNLAGDVLIKSLPWYLTISNFVSLPAPKSLCPKNFVTSDVSLNAFKNDGETNATWSSIVTSWSSKYVNALFNAFNGLSVMSSFTKLPKLSEQ